uniref:Uncharacterized protein n=1 Tax=Arundo donax TaxID=35708 RepID=A0A0A9BXZ7_ARUDO
MNSIGYWLVQFSPFHCIQVDPCVEHPVFTIYCI